jgi:hypothetical protein
VKLQQQVENNNEALTQENETAKLEVMLAISKDLNDNKSMQLSWATPTEGQIYA